MFNLNKYFFAIALCLVSQVSTARWANFDDAQEEFLKYKTDYNIEKNGEYTVDVERHSKILKDGPVRKWSSFRLTYNESTEKVKIIEAYTVNKGKKQKVDLNRLEDKPMASSTQGFDQTRQMKLLNKNVVCQC